MEIATDVGDHSGKLQGGTALVTGATTRASAGPSPSGSPPPARRCSSRAGPRRDVAETVRACATSGRDVDGVAADLSTPAGAHDLGRRALDGAGRIDILVNNAGMSTRGDSWTVIDADWEYQLNVNLRAPFILGQYATRDMIERGRGGRIVNISTVGAQRGAPRRGRL